MKRFTALLVAGLLLAGCTTGSPRPAQRPTTEPPTVAAPSAAPTSAEPRSDTVAINVSGHRETVLPVDGVDVRQIRTAAGPAGFYWALPQPVEQRPPGGGIAAPSEPAVIHYTLYDLGRPINEPGRNDVVYKLPLKDVANTGATPGGLMLAGLNFHWPWLFIKYAGIVPGGARSAYTGLLAWDIRTPERPHRFLYRGLEAGGGYLAWAASSDYVVWIQDWVCSPDWPGTCRAASVYDLNTGRQQALPLPPDQAIRDLALDGAQLRYTANGEPRTLQLPAPGTAPLPSVAFGGVSLAGFGGTVYLPGLLPPEPFYQVNCTVSADHYRVEFNGTDVPIPLNATREEAGYTGASPSLAQTLGLVEGYADADMPAAAREAWNSLPDGQTFSFRRGARVLEGHFASDGGLLSTIWWQDGGWRYRINDHGIGWQSPDDPGLQDLLARIMAKLPPDGGPVPGADQGLVEYNVAGDHESPSLWFPINGEWLHVGGYKYDALLGARDLVPVRTSRPAGEPAGQVLALTGRR